MSGKGKAPIKSRFWCNGAEVDQPTFVVSAASPAFTVGYSAFETMRSYGGRVFRLNAHLARLDASLKQMGVATSVSSGVLALLQQAASEGPTELRLRLTYTAEGASLLEVGEIDPDKAGRAVTAVTRSWQPPSWLNGEVKHGSRAFGEVVMRQAAVDEVLWRGADGCFTEGARSNIFAVIGQRVVTPALDGRILAGITRGALIDAAREAELEIVESSVHPAMPIDELYVSSTLKELAPVVRVDDRDAPGAGPVGQQLYAAFRALVARECGL